MSVLLEHLDQSLTRLNYELPIKCEILCHSLIHLSCDLDTDSSNSSDPELKVILLTILWFRHCAL